jgi:SAM-dependent methyltransferase
MNESKVPFLVSLSGKKTEVDRPEPITEDIEVLPYKKRMGTQEGVEALLEGYYVLIVDFYSSGLSILEALKDHLAKKYKGQSFQAQRDFRSAFRTFSRHLLLLVSDHKISARKSPDVPWLKILYPELSEFYLPFPQVQGLNSSWQWYKNGISIPVLKKRLYPFFGSYFPTRFEHLSLFDEWLKKYKGERKSAIDIGIGSGVLSFQLLENGFEKVYGTDANPNAIIGLTKEFNSNALLPKMELFYGDLFADLKIKSELIIFNPPWIPATQDIEGLDTAIYYDTELFPRFFSEAIKYLNPEGRIVLLFSNLAEVSHQTKAHPIEEELKLGGRFEKELFLQKKVGRASEKTRRNQHWREEERVELWVLKKSAKLEARSKNA